MRTESGAATQPHTRRFIRHPSGMPIQLALRGDVPPVLEHLRNVSQGGLCFCACVELDPGQCIHLRIPVVDQLFEADGVVTWCREVESDHYEVGVRFADADALFSVRMVEQLCHIEQYRKEVLREEGRQLSSEEAASEWIDRFAGNFPPYC